MIAALRNKLEIQDTLADRTALFANSRSGIYELLLAGLAALMVHIVLWIAWPPHPGPDARSYISFYVNVFESDVVANFSLLYVRGLVPSFLHGWSLAQGSAVHIGVQSLLAVSSAVMFYLIARHWGRGLAIGALLVFLLNLPLQLFFHQVSSEGAFTWSVLFLALCLLYALRSEAMKWAILAGLALGLAYLSRPTGLIMAGAGLVFLFTGVSWRRKLSLSLAFGCTFLGIVAPWVIYRNMRMGDWSISRVQSAPLFTMIYDMGLIQAENGAATAEFVQIIEDVILQYPTYQAAGLQAIDIYIPPDRNRFIYLNDIIFYTDVTVDWESGRDLLEAVALEAIQANPRGFLLKAVEFLQITLLQPERRIIMADGDALIANMRPYPIPPEGRLDGIPRYSFYITHPAYYTLPSRERIEMMQSRETELVAQLYQAGNRDLSRLIVSLWINFSALPLGWGYIFVLLSLVLSRGKSRIYLFALLFFGLSIAVLSGLISPEIRYRMPIDFILILTALISVKALLSAVYLGFFPNNDGAQGR